MDPGYDHICARMVFDYLVNVNMIDLAQCFYQNSSCLSSEGSLVDFLTDSVSFFRIPLHKVVTEYHTMKIQMLQLTNLCKDAIQFPEGACLREQISHLIQMLEISGAGQVLDTVISMTPIMETTQDSVSDGQNTLTSEVSYDTMPITMENTTMPHKDFFDIANMSIIEQSDVNTDPIFISIGSDGTIQPNPQITSMFPATEVNPIPSANQCTVIHQPPPIAPTQLSCAPMNESIGTGIPPAPEALPRQLNPASFIAPPVPNGILNGAAALSNSTPVDNPILPGGTSTRSTSSQKRTHIRTLDFGTPTSTRSVPAIGSRTPYYMEPLSEGSGSKILQSNGIVASPSTSTNVHTIAKPHSINPEMCESRSVRVMNRSVGMSQEAPPGTTEPSPIGNVHVVENGTLGVVDNARRIFHQPSAPPRPAMNPINPINPEQTTTTTIFSFPTPKPDVTVAMVSPSHRPDSGCSGSPTRDPIYYFPMTPRFLSRPLQPLTTQKLSPYLNLEPNVPMDRSSGKLSFIMTPRYAITPGHSSSVSPLEEGVAYYRPDEGQNGTDGRGSPESPEAEEDVETVGRTEVVDESVMLVEIDENRGFRRIENTPLMELFEQPTCFSL